MSETLKVKKANSQSSTESESDSSDMQKHTNYKSKASYTIRRYRLTTIKNRNRKIYLSLPTTTLDLYQTNIKTKTYQILIQNMTNLTKIVQNKIKLKP